MKGRKLKLREGNKRTKPLEVDVGFCRVGFRKQKVHDWIAAAIASSSIVDLQSGTSLIIRVDANNQAVGNTYSGYKCQD